MEDKIADILMSGGVGVIPTDTIYGIVGKAEMPEAVERIYKIRRRSENKPCIVLMGSMEDLGKFNVEIPNEIREVLNKVWPGKVSVVLPSTDPRFDYLSRGTKSIAFRMPDQPELLDLLRKVGPLVAPSANREGEPPATNIAMAKEYFEDSVDLYVDGGEMQSLPSTLIRFEDNKPVVLRQGAVRI